MEERNNGLQRRAILNLWDTGEWTKADIARALGTSYQRVDYLVKTKKGATTDTLGDTTTDPQTESAQ